MARRTRREAAGDGYWAARVRSPAFKRALAALMRDELRTLAAEPVGNLLTRERGRRLIREWDARLVDRTAMVDVALDGNRRLTRRLGKRTQSLLDLLDPALVADLDAVVARGTGLTARAKTFIAGMMEQDFMRGLFTDLIYSALVSFYQRVDPLFGGLAVRALEGQIKAFIRFFMPMVEARATAFAIAADNQAIVVSFARALVHRLLGVPLGRWAELAEAGPRRSAEAFVRQAARDTKLAALLQQAVLAAWDELYAAVRHRRVGELVRVEQQASWLAERCAELLLPALARPGIIAFLTAETAQALRSGRRAARRTD